MNSIFFSYVSDDYYEKVGTPKLLNSFNKFHPGIPFKVFRQEEIDKVFKDNPWMGWNSAKATFAKLLAKDYDLVICMDADQLILGSLDEILFGNYSVAVVQNNGKDEHYHMGDLVSEGNYINAGLVASTDYNFWNSWEALNKLCADNVEYQEQGTLNYLIHYSVPKHKLIHLDNFAYYGTSSRNMWDQIYLKDNYFMLNGKQVKVIHEAGGHFLPKLQFKSWGLDEQVRDRIDYLVGKD